MRLGTIETIVKYTSSNQDAGNLNTLFPCHDITTAHIHLQLLTLLGKKKHFYLHNEAWCLIETEDITVMSNLCTVMFVVLYALFREDGMFSINIGRQHRGLLHTP